MLGRRIGMESFSGEARHAAVRSDRDQRSHYRRSRLADLKTVRKYRSGRLGGWVAFPANGHRHAKNLLKQLPPPLGPPNVHLRLFDRHGHQRDAIVLNHRSHISDLLRTAAIEPPGEPENGRQPPHPLFFAR